MERPAVTDRRNILILGNPSPEHVGAHFLHAAVELGISASLIDTNHAWPGHSWRRRFHHHLLQKRPTALAGFSKSVVELCRARRPRLLLTTGIAPLSTSALDAIGRLGIARVNYLTDDPWNPANEAAFFWDALPAYDAIFSPRRSNIGDLLAHGCARVHYMPFAYSPKIHFSEAPRTEAERARFACDVAFIGGADADRLALVRPLLRGPWTVGLYGGYWDRDRECASRSRGMVIGRDLRLAVNVAIVHLCMGRRANRDGHAMRSFELPAMGAAMIVEDTAEHREIFGPDGSCVVYYRSPGDIPTLAAKLLDDSPFARRLAEAATNRICKGENTYADRLKEILRQSS